MLADFSGHRPREAKTPDVEQVYLYKCIKVLGGNSQAAARSAAVTYHRSYNRLGSGGGVT